MVTQAWNHCLWNEEAKKADVQGHLQVHDQVWEKSGGSVKVCLKKEKKSRCSLKILIVLVGNESVQTGL